MPISQLNVLVGKSYRTVANEVREVSALEKDEVVYRSIFATGGRSGVTVRTPDKRLALARFAAEAEGEIVPR